MLHVSTDYVFPGDARQPYPKTHRPVPSTRTDGASWRRASSDRAAAPHRLHRAHRLAIQRTRPQLRDHHAPTRHPARHPGCGGRPARPADLVPRTRRAAGRPRPSGSGRCPPRHGSRPHHVLRLGPGGLPSERPRS
ncbi:hypothetical protein [Streptomyces sp. NPDC005077]|uniref:hypothetical protein n=1 Tax=Streptomyces sp. NPDC005077 TaxID=3154292 RepID=UPI0033ABEBB2